MLRRPNAVPALGAAIALACAAAGGIALAQDAQPGVNPASAVKQPVPSSNPGALKRPEEWDCGYVVPEWEEWLEQGNPPQDWQFAQDTFRDVEDGELYNWQDWLDWFEDAGCPPGGLVEGSQAAAGATSGSLAGTPAIIGGILGGLGLVSVVAGASGGTDSPG